MCSRTFQPDFGGDLVRYTVQVIETISVLKEYAIEASDPDEAVGKAESGETIHEKTIKELDVLNRIVDSLPEEDPNGV
jgi:hypothetical protein